MMNRLQAMRIIWQTPVSALAELYGTHDIRDIDSISWEWVKWLDTHGDEFVYYDIVQCWHIYTRETSDAVEKDNQNIKLPF